MMVSEYYDFEIEKPHGVILSNILLKNLVNVTSPRLGREPALKMLKLSSKYVWERKQSLAGISVKSCF